MSKIMRDFLRSDGSIIINKRLARAIGLDATILYSELISKSIYYENVDRLEADGSFFSTIEDMEKDTTLSIRQQAKAIKLLVELELIEYQVRGLPPKRYFRLPDSEDSLLKILEVKNQFEQNAQIQFTQNAHIDLSETHKTNCAKRTTNNTNTTILNNNTKKNKDIAAKPAVSSNRPSNTLFDLPSSPVQLSRIDQARASGDWRKVTTSDFVQYFVDRQNEMFPVKINLPKSKDGNYQVSMFRKNLIERYEIAQDSICDTIEQILDIYKQTETNAAYRDSFDLSTFKHEWKIDQLMQSIERVDKYGSNRKRTEYAPDPDQEIF